MNEKLLQCPFCGGKAGYYVSGLKDHVYCRGCGVITNGSYTNREPDWGKKKLVYGTLVFLLKKK